MKSTNRKWQRHLRSKGPIGFFFDRMQAHVFSSSWQHENGPFRFPIEDRQRDDEFIHAFWR